MSKETKGARRRRVFSGMNIADLRLLKEHKALPRGMKAEELDAEIERREAIAERTKGQDRAGGRFTTQQQVVLKEGPKDLDPGKAVSFEDRVRRIVREEQKARPDKNKTANISIQIPERIGETMAGFSFRANYVEETQKKLSLLRRLKRWLI